MEAQLAHPGMEPPLPSELERLTFSWPRTRIHCLFQGSSRWAGKWYAQNSRSSDCLFASSNTRTPAAIPVDLLLQRIAQKPAVVEAGARHLYAGGGEELPPATLNTIFPKFQGITDIFSHHSLGHSLEAFKTLRSLRRLTVDLAILFAPFSAFNFTPACLYTVTHLAILDDPADEDPAQYGHLTLLPAPTHLSMYHLNLRNVLHPLFRKTLSRLLCIFLLSSEVDAGYYQEDIRPLSADDRLVHIGRVTFLADWFEAAKSGEDHWSRADVFFLRRRDAQERSTDGLYHL
ncbi:hypothetical protein C8R46DRAFT_1099245 [Mycena filopes]|nr:hypothetical protein C8R46DRAFT_1099245 [Mycena filopes]